jgi:hypothetical protein
VKSNHATAKTVVERLPLDDEDEPDAGESESTDGDEDDASDASDGSESESDETSGPGRPTALGSRDNFWGG